MKRAVHTFFRYFPVSDRDRRFGLYLTTAGESRIPPGFAYPPAGHPGAYQFDWKKGRVLREYQIVYISSGQGRLEVARAIHEALRRMADPTQEMAPLPELARGLGVSYTWFRRAFLHHTGLSPHQYRLQLKVGRARALLSETSLTVKEVAFRSGF